MRRRDLRSLTEAGTLFFKWMWWLVMWSKKKDNLFFSEDRGCIEDGAPNIVFLVYDREMWNMIVLHHPLFFYIIYRIGYRRVGILGSEV